MGKRARPSEGARLLYPLSRRLMVNNARPFVKSCKHKRNKANADKLNDLLSQLPDEIIMETLSRLTMKEVAKIGVVSRKWRKVWRCYPILDFEDSRSMAKRMSKGVGDKLRLNFVSRVNHIVEQHFGQSIDEFRVAFDLDNRFHSHIDKWIAFASAKQVKRLELDFTPDLHRRDGQYAWPKELPYNKETWKHTLTSLCLKCINITAEAVECFLNSFLFLENLCICSAEVLTSVGSCSSLSLKSLEVTLCWDLITIDLNVPKLLTFVYEGPSIKLYLRNASSVTVASIGTVADNNPIAYAFHPCLNFYAQLESLELKFSLRDELNWQIDQCPVLTNLKHLTLYVPTDHESSLLGWTSLISASPVLQKLTLKLVISGYSFGREIRKRDGCPLKCLKTLEIVGLIGRCVDLEIAMYVLENAIMLEEVILDARRPSAKTTSRPNLFAQKRAMKLSSKLRQGVKLTFR